MGPLRAEELSRSVRGRTRLPERREGGGGGRPLSRATAPEPEGSMSDTRTDLWVNMCMSLTHFFNPHPFSESVGSNDVTQLKRK